ncbi:unnamed protein product [Arctogadus glacialis]
MERCVLCPGWVERCVLCPGWGQGRGVYCVPAGGRGADGEVCTVSRLGADGEVCTVSRLGADGEVCTVSRLDGEVCTVSRLGADGEVCTVSRLGADGEVCTVSRLGGEVCTVSRLGADGEGLLASLTLSCPRVTLSPGTIGPPGVPHPQLSTSHPLTLSPGGGLCPNWKAELIIPSPVLGTSSGPPQRRRSSGPVIRDPEQNAALRSSLQLNAKDLAVEPHGPGGSSLHSLPPALLSAHITRQLKHQRKDLRAEVEGAHHMWINTSYPRGRRRRGAGERWR